MSDSKCGRYVQKRLQDGNSSNLVNKVPDEVPDKIWSTDHNVIRFSDHNAVNQLKNEDVNI